MQQDRYIKAHRRDQAPSESGTGPGPIDFAEAARFLKLLDPTATKFDFRTFDDNKARKDKNLTRKFYGTLPQYAAELKSLNERGAGVFVVINETNGKGCENEDITRARAQFIDLDGTPLDKVRAARVQPHIVVASSPGKWHCHWLVDGMPLENFTLVQEALIATFDSDPNVKALAGVMRLPGFYHNKAEPFQVRIVDTLDNEPPYPPNTFRLAERGERAERDEDVEINIEKVCAALYAATNPDVDEETWYRLMASAHAGSAGATEAFKAFNEGWSIKSTKKHNARRNEDRWEAFDKKPPRDIGPGTLYAYADATAPGWRDAYEQAAEEGMYAAFAKAKQMQQERAKTGTTGNGAIESPGHPALDDDAADRPQGDGGDGGDGDPPQDGDGAAAQPGETAPAFSEEALALLFSMTHAGALRYVAKWGQWFIFDGTTWKVAEKMEPFSMARQICRDAANVVNKPKEAKAIASARTRSAIVSLASCDRRHAATVDQWDSDPLLLNTPGGVVDLRTGKLRDHRITDYMTKITAVTPDRQCPIPLWTAFLKRVLANDIELENFIKRWLGYDLTGITIEHALAFLYGMGRNGKGVLMNTVAQIMKDYQVTATQETFTVNNSERHPADMAMLRGARLVMVAETEQGKRWAESRIKQMTGGDPITARFMRQDFFTYMPQFKLMISGQHKPGLNAVNEAIKSRVNMVPFNVIIPLEERDTKLTEKLKAEWPGILAWMIDGCLEWQRMGLKPPKIVTDATENYMQAQDKLGRWMEDRCDQTGDERIKPTKHEQHAGKPVWTGSSELFASWKHWAGENGEFLGSQTKLSGDLTERGFQSERRNFTDKDGKISKIMGFAGLRLKTFTF